MSRDNLLVLPAPPKDAKVFSPRLDHRGLEAREALNFPRFVLFREGDEEMSIRVCDAVWKRGPKNRAQKAVLAAIASFTDDKDFAYPFIRTIAERSRYNERHVRRILAILVHDGWLAIRPHPSNHKGQAYQLDVNRFSADILSPSKAASQGKMSADKPGKMSAELLTPSINCNPPNPPLPRGARNRRNGRPDASLGVGIKPDGYYSGEAS